LWIFNFSYKTIFLFLVFKLDFEFISEILKMRKTNEKEN
jgi:hypothetical protein